MPASHDDGEAGLQRRDFIASLSKGLEVLRAFDKDAPELSTADLAEKLSMSRASARRFLLTLAELGYLRKRGQYFQPTSKVLSLSAPFFTCTPLSTVAQPHLEEVTRRTEESCSLGILENKLLVFVARSQSRWILNLGLRVGSELPAYCTAMGRVLLAAMPEQERAHYLDTVDLRAFNEKTVTDVAELHRILAGVHQQGFALVDQELEQGLRSIAVPVTQGEEVIASISVSTQVNRTTLRRLKQDFLPILREAASAISSEISHL